MAQHAARKILLGCNIGGTGNDSFWLGGRVKLHLVGNKERLIQISGRALFLLGTSPLAHCSSVALREYCCTKMKEGK
jgi:hypothetical protein